MSSARTEQISSLIAHKLGRLVEAADLVPIPSRHDATPLVKGGPKGMLCYDAEPTFIEESFNVLVSCTRVNNAQVVLAQGREQTATAFAMYFAYTFYQLSVVDPASSVITEVRKRYKSIFPPTASSEGTLFNCALIITGTFVAKRWNPNQIWGSAKKQSFRERMLLTHYMVWAAKYQRYWNGKVPRWILRFALDSLSLDLQHPIPVIAGLNLTILAIDMGCDVAVIGKRYVYSSVAGICPADQGPVHQFSMFRISLSRKLERWLKPEMKIQYSPIARPSVQYSHTPSFGRNAGNTRCLMQS